MTQKEKDVAFLNDAIKHEELMAALYALFETRVPASASLWAALVREERLHAERLRILLQEVEADRASLDPKRHTDKSMKASMDSIRGKIAIWKRDGVPKADAYQYAMLLEGGMIEEKLFVSCEEDSPVAEKVFYELRSGTNNHFDRLTHEYEKNNLSAGFITHLKAKFKSIFGSDE